MKIGIFDSGLGGLCVLHQAKKMLHGADFIYYADEEHVPYGEKTPKQVKEFVKEIFDFMIGKEVDAIVIACNTATSIVSMEFRNNFPVPIIGMEPAVKKAVDMYGNENKRILVAATPITIHGKKLHDLVEHVDIHHDVDLIPLPGLVRFAEKGQFEGIKIEDYLRKELNKYDIDSYGTIVLGCTHFNYFKSDFKKIFGEDIHFVDGNEGTINQLIRVLPKDISLEGIGDIQYYFSGVRSDDNIRIKKCISQLEGNV